MNEEKSGFDSGAPKKPTEWVQGEVEGKNSKVKFEQVRPRTPDGKLASGGKRNRATVTFSAKLLKAKLGEDRYKKLLKARRRKEPLPQRFVTPKISAGTYQPKGGEQGFLACPLPTGERAFPISPAVDEIVESVKAELGEDDVLPVELQARERLHVDETPHPKQHHTFNDASFLGMDLSTETIWKERGSDFDGMAEQVMSWKYFLSVWGMVQLLAYAKNKIAFWWKTALYKTTGAWYLTGSFSVFSRLQWKWRGGPGHFWAKAQRFGWRPAIRHWLVKNGRLNPQRREVQWKDQEYVVHGTPGKDMIQGYLATRYTPASQGGVTPVLEKARELGVDASKAVNVWAAHCFNGELYDWSFKHVWEREISKLKGMTLEKARADWIDWHTKRNLLDGETDAEHQLRVFVVTMLADADPPERPEAPKPEHVVDLYKATRDLWNSCTKCRGSKKFWDSKQNRYVDCDAHGEKATRQAVVEVKNGVLFIRCPDCNTFDAHIWSAGDYRCDGCAVVFNYDGRQQ